MQMVPNILHVRSIVLHAVNRMMHSVKGGKPEQETGAAVARAHKLQELHEKVAHVERGLDLCFLVDCTGSMVRFRVSFLQKRSIREFPECTFHALLVFSPIAVDCPYLMLPRPASSACRASHGLKYARNLVSCTIAKMEGDLLFALASV